MPNISKQCQNTYGPKKTNLINHHTFKSNRVWHSEKCKLWNLKVKVKCQRRRPVTLQQLLNLRMTSTISNMSYNTYESTIYAAICRAQVKSLCTDTGRAYAINQVLFPNFKFIPRYAISYWAPVNCQVTWAFTYRAVDEI